MRLLENPEKELLGRPRNRRRLFEVRHILARGAILAALAGLTLNILSLDALLRPLGQVPATSPVTVIVTAILASAILRCKSAVPLGGRDLVAVAVGMWVAAIVCLADFVWSVRILDGTLNIHVGPDTALILSLIAIALILRKRSDRFGLTGALGAFGLILNAMIAQSYGLPLFGGNMAYLTMAAMLALSLATLHLYLHHPLVAVVALQGAIGRRTRAMLSVGFLVPWVCGLLLYRVFGTPPRDYPVESLMVTAIIWSMAAVTLLSGQLHEKSDKLRRAAESKLARQAMSDQLTGLLNRTGITRQLDVRWARFQQTGEASAIILMDIDHFKSINDTHGHDVGDKVLIAVGKALRPFMRQNDAIGRWGGEEFLVIIEKTNLHNLAQVAERLRRAVGELTESPALRADGIGACKVSASFGISMMAAQDDSYDAAIKRADQALYAAKSNGRNRVVFDPVLRLVA